MNGHVDFIAISTLRIWSTFAPRDASSSISSYEIARFFVPTGTCSDRSYRHRPRPCNLALVSADGCCYGDGARVRSAAPQRGDISNVVDPLEPGNDGDLSTIERFEILQPSIALMRALVNASSVSTLT